MSESPIICAFLDFQKPQINQASLGKFGWKDVSEAIGHKFQIYVQ
ncbi:hypothetical protein [Mucilaginibacter sp.]|jgi:hypothetical protein